MLAFFDTVQVKNAVISTVIITTTAVWLASPGVARAERDSGGIASGIGFGTASLAGDLGRRFEGDSVAVRMRSGMRHNSFGVELDLSIVNLKDREGAPNDDNWVATMVGPSLSYHVYWHPLSLYVRAGLGIGNIAGPAFTDTVPCTGNEDCQFKEVTVKPSLPAFSVEISTGAHILLARRRQDAYPVLWVDWTVRTMRALVDDAATNGRVQQLAIGMAYGRSF